jgi:chromosomal replication initiation ATPase DnaA
MRRLRAENFTLLQIGRWLGRDHTTVLHHLRSN